MFHNQRTDHTPGSWRPDLYAEIAKFIGRTTAVLDDYCRGYSVGPAGQFIAHFEVRPLGKTETEPVWYEIDHTGSKITTLRYQWSSPGKVVPLLASYLFTAVDKK